MRSIVVLVAGLLIALSSHAQTQSTNAADTDFVRRASSAGLTAIALGKLAATQASSDDVKKFAARMVTDHTKCNADLGKLAGSKGIQIAIAPEPAQQQLIDRLKDLDGSQFDREYADAAIRDHKRVSGLYELEASKGEDVEIREFARKTLPMLKEHEDLADGLPPF